MDGPLDPPPVELDVASPQDGWSRRVPGAADMVLVVMAAVLLLLLAALLTSGGAA